MSDKLYICIEDRQGGDWSVGNCQDAQGWKESALQWADSDEDDELYNDVKSLDSSNNPDELIEFISDWWGITIVPLDEVIDIITDPYNNMEIMELIANIYNK